YGYPYHGRRAASGEIYDMEQFTAAHRTLPFGSLVRVENLENGRRVQVRINDRGPFVEGRIIDLSRAAARALGLLGSGTARVRLVLVGLPSSPQGGWFAVQTGAFRERANAERQRRRLERRYGEVRIVPRDGDPVLWRVVVGREATLEAAQSLAGRLRAKVGEAFVVRLDEPPGDHL
ncbi:MAG: septal ring lytic transglycosylase RlpA family protein, partial [Bryobacteraceae bacterium]